MMLSLLLCAVVAAGDAGSTVDAGVAVLDASVVYDPAVPSTWRLSDKLKPGSPARVALVRDLTRWTPDGGNSLGEMALTADEANALLDDPRAQMTYGDRTVAIVAPSMIVKQRKDHLDLKKLFLKEERVVAGAGFAREHEAVLAAVESKTKVDREIIVAILMWETKLGTITGDYRAFNAFTSQTYFIDDASAVAMSRDEEKKMGDPESQKKRVETIRERAGRNLVALIRQCKAKGIDPLEIKGSWAGALGYPQFMPASLRWADDGNGDGKIDLFNFDDSIASIGRYLKENGFSRAGRSKAVWSYNHEAAYVEGVLAFADALHAMRVADGGTAPVTAPTTP